jgi:alanine racemase
LQLIGWSKKEPAVLQCLQIDKHGMITDLVCLYNHEQFAFSIPFTDEASIFNALTVCTAALSLGMNKEELVKEMFLLKPVAMRLELKPGINQCAIINDSYSADIDSLSIALDFLLQQDQQVHKTVILSDMQHAPEGELMLYGKVAQILNNRNIQKLIAVGPELNRHRSMFDKVPQTYFYPDTASLQQDLVRLKLHQEIILLKGARKYGFEQLSRQLEQKLHDTVLEIDLQALRNNLRTYRRKLHPDTKLMVMVKAFGYGSGSAEIAALMQREGVDMLAVAYADEGVELRRAGIRLPIMVMNVSEAGFKNLVNYQLEPEIYSPAVFNAFTAFLQEKKITGFPIHIKLDTGMHRLGFTAQDIPFLQQQLVNLDRVKIKSVFTHLVASEDPQQDDFTHHQFKLFMELSKELQAMLQYDFIRHVCNSAAIGRFPDFHLGMVRLGIGLYGAAASTELQTVTTLKTTIAQIKKVQPGDTVGYGRKGKITQPSTIATVRIGYADGYPRSLGNGNGKMSIGHQWVPVIGNVCMDMTMLDITGVEAAEGDEVIVFGSDPTVHQVAGWAGTIAYEVLTNISQRVKRVYFEE